MFTKGSKLFNDHQEQVEKQSNTPWNFKMKYEEKNREIVLLEALEDVPTEFIHKIRVGNRTHPVVCLGDNCPACQAFAAGKKDARQAPCAFFSILDLNPFTRNGQEVPGDRKILAATSKSYELIVSEMNDEADGNFVMARVLVSRGKAGTPSPPITGDKYRFKGHYTKEELLEKGFTEDQLKPFTLEEVASTIETDPEKIAELAEQAWGIKSGSAPEDSVENQSGDDVSYDLD